MPCVMGDRGPGARLSASPSLAVIGARRCPHTPYIQRPRGLLPYPLLWVQFHPGPLGVPCAGWSGSPQCPPSRLACSPPSLQPVPTCLLSLTGQQPSLSGLSSSPLPKGRGAHDRCAGGRVLVTGSAPCGVPPKGQLGPSMPQIRSKAISSWSSACSGPDPPTQSHTQRGPMGHPHHRGTATEWLFLPHQG